MEGEDVAVGEASLPDDQSADQRSGAGRCRDDAQSEGRFVEIVLDDVGK